MATYKIIFKGEVSENSDRGKIDILLAKFFKIPVAKANKLFNGNAYALKKGLDVDEAIALQQKLLGIGVITRLIKEETLASDITYQEPASECQKNKPTISTNMAKTALLERTVNTFKRYWSWTKTPKGKKVFYTISSLAVIVFFSQNYFADCNSAVTRIALKKLVSKSVSAVTQLSDDQFDTELSGIAELQFNQQLSTYTCKAKVVVTDTAGNTEMDDVIYQVIKRGLSKPHVKIP